MTDIVIASAARTAVGSFGGSFAKVPAHDLGSSHHTYHTFALAKKWVTLSILIV